jgi:hypothetical protein
MRNDQELLEIPVVEEDKPATETKPKNILKKLKIDSANKHSYSMMKLDHIIDYVSHPIFILGITALFALLFSVTKYLGIARNDELLKTISNDLGKILSYIVTVIVTFIVTRFLEIRKK